LRSLCEAVLSTIHLFAATDRVRKRQALGSPLQKKATRENKNHRSFFARHPDRFLYASDDSRAIRYRCIRVNIHACSGSKYTDPGTRGYRRTNTYS
jgi:hypothetical protein